MGGRRAPHASAATGDLERLVERLRRLPAGRLRAWREPLADVAQRWADLDADLEGEPRRTVPRLEGDLALVDQVAVLGRDLLAAAAARPDAGAALDAARHDVRSLLAGLAGPPPAADPPAAWP